MCTKLLFILILTAKVQLEHSFATTNFNVVAIPVFNRITWRRNEKYFLYQPSNLYFQTVINELYI